MDQGSARGLVAVNLQCANYNYVHSNKNHPVAESSCLHLQWPSLPLMQEMTHPIWHIVGMYTAGGVGEMGSAWYSQGPPAR